MERVISVIRNPLAIIGVFALLLEGGLTVGLGRVDVTVQPLLIWLMGILGGGTLLGFFAVLVWRPHHFYGPADFREEANYMALQTTASAPQSQLQVGNSEPEPAGPPPTEYSASLAVAEQTGTPSAATSDVEDHTQRIQELERQLINSRWQLHFEYLYRTIFGSQLFALEMLRIRGEDGAGIGDLALFYEQNHVKRVLSNGLTPFPTPEDWITFPLAQALVSRDLGGVYRITLKGAALLGYLRAESMPLGGRPN